MRAKVYYEKLRKWTNVFEKCAATTINVYFVYCLIAVVCVCLNVIFVPVLLFLFVLFLFLFWLLNFFLVLFSYARMCGVTSMFIPGKT